MKRFLLYLFVIMIAGSGCSRNDNNHQDQQIVLEEQLLALNSVHNARQLGCYRIGDKTIKADVLLRSGNLAELTSEDSTLLCQKYHLQRIYDFRSQEEIESAPDIIPGNATSLELSVSFVGEEGRGDAPVSNQKEIAGWLLENASNSKLQQICWSLYDNILLTEASQAVYRDFFADLVKYDPADGAILWHCTQGKDRAGCASALILAALGAERELIVADFLLSKEYYDPLLSRIETETEDQKFVINSLLSANADIFEATLNKIDEQYGSLREYMSICLGVTPQMMERLREMYLE